MLNRPSHEGKSMVTKLSARRTDCCSAGHGTCGRCEGGMREAWGAVWGNGRRAWVRVGADGRREGGWPPRLRRSQRTLQESGSSAKIWTSP